MLAEWTSEILSLSQCLANTSRTWKPDKVSAAPSNATRLPQECTKLLSSSNMEQCYADAILPANVGREQIFCQLSCMQPQLAARLLEGLVSTCAKEDPKQDSQLEDCAN